MEPAENEKALHTTTSRVSRASMDKRGSIDHRDADSIMVAEERVRAHDEFTEQEYSRLIRKVDFILMVCIVVSTGLRLARRS